MTDEELEAFVNRLPIGQAEVDAIERVMDRALTTVCKADAAARDLLRRGVRDRAVLRRAIKRARAADKWYASIASVGHVVWAIHQIRTRNKEVKVG